MTSPLENLCAPCKALQQEPFDKQEYEGLLSPEVWDYVIVHELLHFDIPNHGKLWKSLMRAHVARLGTL